MKLDWRIDDDYGGCEGSRGGIYRRTGFDFIAGTGIGGKAALDVLWRAGPGLVAED